jgi:hypothetical protein
MENEIEQSILDTIQNVCSKLSNDSVSMKEVAQSLGALLKIEGVNMQANIAPSISGVEEIRVNGQPNTSDALSHIELKLVDPSPLQLKTLEKKYGQGKALQKTTGSTGPRAEIPVSMEDKPFNCCITASLTKNGRFVTFLTLRRDNKQKLL